MSGLPNWNSLLIFDFQAKCSGKLITCTEHLNSNTAPDSYDHRSEGTKQSKTLVKDWNFQRCGMISFLTIFTKMPIVLVHSMVYPKLLKNCFASLKTRISISHVSPYRKTQNIKICKKNSQWSNISTEQTDNLIKCTEFFLFGAKFWVAF